jgi:hypothetical protein
MKIHSPNDVPIMMIWHWPVQAGLYLLKQEVVIFHESRLEFGREEKIGDVFVEHILLLGRWW